MNVCVLDGVAGTDHHAVAQIDSGMAHAGGVVGSFEKDQITGLCFGLADVGRTTANGLWNKSQHISEAEAKPGDLVFFKGTYDTPGMSHTGIYLGNGMMVSAGDPIKYANIHSSYWEKHLAGFGRLSK